MVSTGPFRLEGIYSIVLVAPYYDSMIACSPLEISTIARHFSHSVTTSFVALTPALRVSNARLIDSSPLPTTFGSGLALIVPF